MVPMHPYAPAEPLHRYPLPILLRETPHRRGAVRSAPTYRLSSQAPFLRGRRAILATFRCVVSFDANIADAASSWYTDAGTLDENEEPCKQKGGV